MLTLYSERRGDLSIQCLFIHYYGEAAVFEPLRYNLTSGIFKPQQSEATLLKTPALRLCSFLFPGEKDDILTPHG